MFNGGATINRRTSQIIRLAGLVIPVLLGFYGILIQYGHISSHNYSGDAVFALVMIPWILLAIFQFLTPAKDHLRAGIELLAYHVLAMLYILFVTGLTAPFAVAWVLLFIGTYAYFSTAGIWFSIGALLVTGIVDVLMHSSDVTISSTDIMTTLSILVVGVAAVAIGHEQEIDGAELSRSKALESLQRDRILTIVNNLADAILSTDAKGIVKVYNAASLSLLDTNTDLNDRPIRKIITLYDRNNKEIDIFESLKASRGVVIRDDLTTVIGGERLRLEVTYTPIRSSYSRSKHSEPQDGYILILRDITKAKSLEEERDEFISVVSHELRTPITITEGTISNVQLMMERSNISPSALKENLKSAHEQVLFLAKMVNDLSTLSRAERGVADAPETIDVRGLINDLYKEYAPQAEQKKLHFNLDLATHLGQLDMSRLYLEELLQNLLTNALKYTKEGSITLQVTRKGDDLTFAVRDTGIGISKSDQSKVFNKFYRSEDYRTRETGGTGLGLYVASKLAAKLDTQIKLQSRLNHGSTFSFTFKTKQND